MLTLMLPMSRKDTNSSRDLQTEERIYTAQERTFTKERKNVTRTEMFSLNASKRRVDDCFLFSSFFFLTFKMRMDLWVRKINVEEEVLKGKGGKKER